MTSLFSSITRSVEEPKTQNGIFIQKTFLPLALKLQKEVRSRKYKEVQSTLQEALDALKEFEKEEWPPKQPPPSPGASAETEDTADSTVVVEDDDPQTREAMHPAIELMLEALIAILSHPAKVAKACDYSLDCIHMLVKNRYVSGRAGGQDDPSGSGSQAQQLVEQGQAPQIPASLLHRIIEAAAKCSDSSVESTQVALIRTLTTIMTSPKCAVHESSMLVAFRSTFHIYLTTKTATDAAKSALYDMLRSVIGRMEAYNAMKQSSTEINMKESEDEALASFASQYHADSYVLFRSLCKMSSKELQAENEETTTTSFFSIQTPNDAMSLNGKILSLELILAAMDFAGEAFCEGERFIYLVQHYLCVSLLKNCMSNHTQVAFLSQKIFLVLLSKFRGHMKQEIEVFMSNVFLRVLESPNASFKQKALVLESLRSLCKDPTLLTQIFLNYDCDFEARNLYKDIVHVLTKLSGRATTVPSSNLSKKDAEQELELTLAGLEVLTTILRAFLKALGLPGGSDEIDEADSAGARIRGMLQLDIGMAAKPEEKSSKGTAATESVASDDLSTSGRSMKKKSSSTESNAGSADVAGKIVDAFQNKRNVEQNFEIGAVKFTLSLKSGLNFFIDNGFVELDAREIALFFLANKDKLDKTQMGEALGREPDAPFIKGEGIDREKGGPGFFVRILHHYVDNLDFTGLMFDDAIRLFLSGFRLPGEAQKIDRIMEKFAERFTNLNPEVFPSADTAFILAFSVIMLNTDLHNPSIKPERRMTIESFIRNNRGIGENGSDLPDDFLVGIFNRIKEHPFSLKEDDAARERAAAPKQLFEASVFFEGSIFGDSAEERRKEQFKKERDEIMAATQQLVRRRTDKRSLRGSSSNLADNVSPADVVKPMFDVTWGPVLGALSQVLECIDDEQSSAVCLNGFVYAIRIAAHSHMSLARDTFVSSLAKFTFLGSIKEMKRKNVESIRTLLSIAVMDGEYLEDSWGEVLQCISQVSRLRLSASGLDTDDAFLVEESSKPPSTPSKMEFFRQKPTNSEQAREAEEYNGKVILEAVQEVLIDKVFSSTVNLSATSLAHFIEQLVEVSSLEIKGRSKGGLPNADSSKDEGLAPARSSRHGEGPSIFLLQKLVEVADYNMPVRPRLVWTQVWEMMADYFAKIACDKNPRVSFFAIDSLKQLSLKFLEKPELSEFNFQRLFLKPFLIVMENENSTEEAREMVLRCIDNIIRTKSNNLRSGWKVVFSILHRSASDASEKVDFLGLTILQMLLDEHLKELCSLADDEDVAKDVETLTMAEKRERNANADDFIGLCKASLSFVNKDEGSDSARPIGLSMRALSHTAIYADLLADHRLLPPVTGAQSTDASASGYTYHGLSGNEALEMTLWRPLFEGLAEGVRSSAKSNAGGVGCLLQRASLLAFRSILLRHGHLFSSPQLAAILEQTFIPSIQAAAENDRSQVVRIISESPSVSSIDFLVEPLPTPPPPDDESLLAFKALGQPPKRFVGDAELLLEASFTDLRHGGHGDARKAYALAKKESHGHSSADQPFPNSWVATTAPLALGILTDVASEIVFPRGRDGLRTLWPLIERQYKVWCIGSSSGNKMIWRPCEALVRIACREFHRLPCRIGEALTGLEDEDRVLWSTTILDSFSNLISESVNKESQTEEQLLRLKQKALLDKKAGDSDEDSLDSDKVERDEERIVTPFGHGMLLGKRQSVFRKGSAGPELTVTTRVIKLDFGATLFLPSVDRDPQSPTTLQNGVPLEVSVLLRNSVPGAYWEKTVPELKIRCVAAHCLQQGLADTMQPFLLYSSQMHVASLFEALTRSRRVASTAVGNEDISTAFQEALFSDWGDGVAAVEEALESAARLSHLHGSGMFFLAQEAGATYAVIRLLSILYTSKSKNRAPEGWDREMFAEQHLFDMMTEVYEKFLASEERDGHLIDPNVWRSTGESGNKIALYCTSFAYVVVEMLKVIRSMRPDQFEKHKHTLFPMACALIRVQSDEIRQYVNEILTSQVGPMIGLPCPA